MVPNKERALKEPKFLEARRHAPVALKKLYWSSRSHWDRIAKLYRLERPLRQFLKHRVTIAQAEQEIKRALINRKQRFLELVRTQVYQNPASPYLGLLKHAGCEIGDLHTQLEKDGLDRTLEQLAGEGVYITPDEFKGKKDLQRGQFCLRAAPADFETPYLPGFGIQSSGTSGSPLIAALTLDHIVARSYVIGTSLAVHDLLKHRLAVYDAILPTGTASIHFLLGYAKLGIPMDRWFARPIPGDAPFGSVYDHLATYLIEALGKLVGPGFPIHQFVDIRATDRIVLWISEAKKSGANCLLHATASNAARIARVAWDKGISLDNAVFLASGEPLTDGKRQVVARTGARVIPRYAFTPGGQVGQGCATPLFTDEVHVNEYMLAVITQPNALDNVTDACGGRRREQPNTAQCCGQP